MATRNRIWDYSVRRDDGAENHTDTTITGHFVSILDFTDLIRVIDSNEEQTEPLPLHWIHCHVIEIFLYHSMNHMRPQPCDRSQGTISGTELEYEKEVLCAACMCGCVIVSDV